MAQAFKTAAPPPPLLPLAVPLPPIGMWVASAHAGGPSAPLLDLDGSHGCGSMAPHVGLKAGPGGAGSKPIFWRAARLLSGILLACGVLFCVLSFCSTTYPIVLSHGFIAFALGLRHAVDCDHLAAIDNVTRQLLLQGQQPVSVGFWFAIGHSTVVLILTAVLCCGYSWIWNMTKDGADFSEYVSLGAGLLSVGLLGAIGLLNAHVAIGLFRDWSGLQSYDESTQDAQVESAGEQALRTAFSVIPGVKRVFEHVNKPFKMYGVGFLFGLSFDSATQVGLIGLAAMTGTSGRVPPLLVMLFPVAFSCGMCLVDTTNGLLMLATYSWTTVRPMQKLFYNFVVTSMSAGIALIICSLELMQIVAREANWNGPFWTWVQNVDMVTIGYSIIVSFMFVFGFAVCYAQGMCSCRCMATKPSDLKIFP
mmetsp:Transcript_91166/g.260845  ORF Transcript_91166/g.260845 Transcript_91166/m.260845 type:complete len:421 (+) Transcript_91166:2-1264(+)